MALSQLEIQHFFLRIGFGETPASIAKYKGISKEQLTEKAFRQSKKTEAIFHLPNPVKKNREVSDFKVFKKTRELNIAWLKQMAESQAQLREKMTFFWHDHFATKVPFAYLLQVQNNTLRKHALGSFRELLHAISKDPAMLIFLNNQQNKKRKPNENFAREVMELFTLGEGNYTEKDIQEAARAFTGWHVNRLGEFEIDERHHDDSNKTIFGKTGNFGGEDVINMLLDNKQTARFVSTKLYRFLVNHEENESFIEEMVDVFYHSDYNIETLLRFILKSDEFYAERNIGTRIASPTELLVRFIRTFNLKFRKDRIILLGQKALGQMLLFPPNVAGWSEQRQWIDSTSLLLRMRLPLVLFGDYDMKLATKNESESEMEMGRGEKAVLRWLKPESDWSGVLDEITETDKNTLIDRVIENFIQCAKDSIDRENLKRFMDNATQETRVKSLTMHVMALPEFQLI